MTDQPAHPDDDVTPAQRAYAEAFLQWFRTRSQPDLRARETALVQMLTEAANR